MVAKGMGFDQRIGPKFLHPGPGYGGSCLPKDTNALLRIAEEHGMKLSILTRQCRPMKNRESRWFRKSGMQLVC